MNYKRKRATTRREDKRVGNKRVRAADRDSLTGRSRAIWHNHIKVEPVSALEEDQRPRKKSGKKSSPSKRRYKGCPGRKRKKCQFLYDTRNIRRHVVDHSWAEGLTHVGYETISEEYRMCAWCDREEFKYVSPYHHKVYWHSVKEYGWERTRVRKHR